MEIIFPVVVIGTQEYNWLIEPFAALFDKYWGEHILYIGDTPPKQLPANVTFMQVPVYTHGVWPWDHWFGNGLLSICRYFAGDIIALFLLDHWLNRPVDLEVVNGLSEYMRSHPLVVRGNLTDQDGWEQAEIIDHCNGLDILHISPYDSSHSFHGGITFCPSLWNVDRLLKVIQPAWTLWECELLGTRAIANHQLISVGTRPAALGRTHGLFHKEPNRVSLAGLNDEDRQLIMSHLPEGYATR